MQAATAKVVAPVAATTEVWMVLVDLVAAMGVVARAGEETAALG